VIVDPTTGNWDIRGKSNSSNTSTKTSNSGSSTTTPSNPSPVLTSAHSLQSTRYGDFSLKGSDGSSIILYDSRELGDYSSSTLFDAGSCKYNKMSNGKPLNASIDLANAGNLSYVEYINSILESDDYKGRKFDNAIFSYHGGKTGPASQTMQDLFGPSSNLHSAIKPHLTGKGSVVYDNCFGVSANINGQSYAISSMYKMPVLTSSFGPVISSVYSLTPTLTEKQNGQDVYTPNDAYWVIINTNP
jgi:hypothetical protein